MLEDWEELADGRLTGSLSGSEVWIVPGARSSDDSGRVTITSAAGRLYVLGVPRTERTAPAPDSALARLEALLPETPSVVVRRYIEGAPPAIREAMRERDAVVTPDNSPGTRRTAGTASRIPRAWRRRGTR